MPLDPQVRAQLELTRRLGIDPLRGDLSTLTAAELRARIDALRSDLEVEQVGAVRDVRLPNAADEDTRLRVYWPQGERSSLPIVVYFHGGGWVVGATPENDQLVRRLVNRTDAIFVLVEYRLAPEHPFPIPVEDCFRGTTWAHDNAVEIGGDPHLIAVAGDSVGANLATVVSLMCKDRGGPELAFQLLVYPCTDMTPERWTSMIDHGTGYTLTADAMRWFCDQYASIDDRAHPYAAPINATDLTGMPPTFLLTAEYDPLCDEGEAYAEALRQAGVAVESRRYLGQVHGFFLRSASLDAATRAQDDAVVALRARFGVSQTERAGQVGPRFRRHPDT
jgi:acetyl esterase